MENEKRMKSLGKVLILVLIEGFLLFLVVSSFGHFVTGQSGGNVTVLTELRVGNVSPEVLNVSIDNFSSTVTLIANSTKVVSCVGLLRDWNGDHNITNVSGQFFETGVGTYNGPNDNNYHYTNNSCNLNYSFGSWNGVTDTPYLALGTCNFSVWYYANPGQWNCTLLVNSIPKLNATGSNVTNISQLLAVGLPDTINYGVVNATYVSSQNTTNVTNEGNTELNLSLYGYAQTPGDGYAMNCTLGSHPYINISEEKYNLTVSHPQPLTLSEFEANYTNLTGTYTVKKFNLNYRQNDTSAGIDDTNATYWRIYVPKGVAGTCTGYIVFGASTAPGS